MKAKRNRIIKLSLLWAAICIVAFSIVAYKTGNLAEYTNESDHIQKEDGTTIVSDNTYGFGTLYKLNEANKVTDIYTTKGESYVSNWKINAICEPAKEDDEGSFYAALTTVAADDHHTLLRVAKVSDGLGLTALTPAYRLHLDGTVSGISQGNDGVIYVTEIHSRGTIASAYEVEEDALLGVGLTSGNSGDTKTTLEADPEDASDVRSARSGDADVFAQAEFAQGMIHTRLSTAPFDEYFTEDLTVKENFDSRSMNILHLFAAKGISAVLIGIFILVGVIIITVMVFALYGRRRAIYRIALFEALLFVLTAGSFLFLTAMETNLQREQFLQYEVYALRNFGLYQINGIASEDFYQSDSYQILLSDIEALIDDGASTTHSVVDVCVVDTATGEIIADAKHCERQSIDFVYGNSAATALKAETRVNLTLPQNDWPASAMSQGIAGTEDYRVVGIFNYASVVSNILGSGQARTWTVVLTFVFLSIAGTVFLLMESRDLDQLTKALTNLADGNLDFYKPEQVYGWDMNRMWNAVHEIGKNIREVNRMQFMTYQAYFRFAPRGIERILHKNSIIDVKSGDSIRFFATIALLSTVGQRGDGKAEMDRRNRFLKMIQSHCAQEDGIYVSGDSALSLMRILFLEEGCHSIRFGTELLMDMANDDTFPKNVNTTVLLHYSPFVYGVAGSEEQAATFLIAKEADELAAYVDWFRELGLHVILTEAVKDRESVAALRYIGFLMLGSANSPRRLNIYEALDAEDFDTRQGKKRTAKEFSDALKLFYGKDFYIARNAFAAILQEVPKDMVAKWYLFECERLLNRQDNHGFAGELHR